jgi:hypothetical protein
LKRRTYNGSSQVDEEFRRWSSEEKQKQSFGPPELGEEGEKGKVRLWKERVTASSRGVGWR